MIGDWFLVGRCEYLGSPNLPKKGVVLNIFDYTIPKEGESFNELFKSKDITITQIVSSDKLEPKEYNQDLDEFVILLEGSATLEIEGSIKNLQKGDCLYIKAHTKHKVLKTSNGALWLAIYYKTYT